MNKFVEGKLSQDFRKNDLKDLKRLINYSTSFTVIGMPGMGISTLLKFLVTRRFAYFVHIDLYELPDLTKVGFFRLIANNLGMNNLSQYSQIELINLIKKELVKLVKKHRRTVLVFNRFDQLKDEFDTSLFSNLRSLLEVDKQRLVFIFSANKPLYKWSPRAFNRSNLDLYSQNFFLKLYTKEELVQLCKLYMPMYKVSEKLLNLSGGHFQLLQLLVRSGRQGNFLDDEFVFLQLKRIYEESFNPSQQRQIQSIAKRKSVKVLDEYIIKMGMVMKVKSDSFLFSPLFAQYLCGRLESSYTLLEQKLLKILKKNKGRTVGKNKIFEMLWPGDIDKQSDWALNALIYRLRKNPTFLQSGYVIVNDKGSGYLLKKN